MTCTLLEVDARYIPDDYEDYEEDEDDALEQESDHECPYCSNVCMHCLGMSNSDFM